MGRKNSDVDNLEKTAAIAYYTAHSDGSGRGGGLGDLDRKESVREADSRSLYGLWGEAREGAETSIVLDARCGMDYDVVLHDGPISGRKNVL